MSVRNKDTVSLTSIQSTGTYTVRRTPLRDLEVTPHNVETAVLLLASNETEVLWPTLRALTKYAKIPENSQTIFDLNATGNITRHIVSRDIVVKRYALLLLSYIAKVPGGTERILSDPQNIKKLASVMTRVEDVHALDFATLCMSILTRNCKGCEQFLIISLWSTLFHRMKKSDDPDVQYNCMVILYNILQMPEGAAIVTRNPCFCWSSILCQLQSKYYKIQQTALDIIKNIVTRFDDVAAQNSFRHSTGIVDLLDVLDNYKFRDIHIPTLDLIHAYVETTENVLHLHKNQGVERLLSYLGMTLPIMKPHVIFVLVKLTFDRRGREILNELKVDTSFCDQLSDSSSQVLAEAAIGITNMASLMTSAVRMADTNVVKSLCAILEDDNMELYDARINSLKALAALCRRIPKVACSLIQPQLFKAIQQTYRVNNDDIPTEAQRLAMQCCLNLQNFADSRNVFINEDFICDAINVLAKAIHVNLRIEHIGFRTALCDLLAASVTDEIAEKYLELGTVQFMIENKLARYKVKSWQAALDQIFKFHLSAKFAYTGRLDINDLTKDKFYVMKKLQSPFPTIFKIKSASPAYQHPVYICQFRHPESKKNSFTDVRTPYQLIEVPQESNPTVDEEKDPSPTPLSSTSSYEETLRKYLTDLILVSRDTEKSHHYLELEEYKYIIRSLDKCIEVSISLKQKAQFLAEFTADRMNCETQDCGVLGIATYLHVLMKAHNSPILSIGDVKCGGPLERSIFYKTLADRLGVPCSLHRVRGNTWCEVAIPEADQNEPPDSVYPHGLLRANYVVDVFHPGLLPKGSYEALRYCGKTQPYYTVSSLGNAEHVPLYK